MAPVFKFSHHFQKPYHFQEHVVAKRAVSQRIPTKLKACSYRGSKIAYIGSRRCMGQTCCNKAATSNYQQLQNPSISDSI